TTTACSRSTARSATRRSTTRVPGPRPARKAWRRASYGPARNCAPPAPPPADATSGQPRDLSVTARRPDVDRWTADGTSARAGVPSPEWLLEAELGRLGGVVEIARLSGTAIPVSL